MAASTITTYGLLHLISKGVAAAWCRLIHTATTPSPLSCSFTIHPRRRLYQLCFQQLCHILPWEESGIGGMVRCSQNALDAGWLNTISHNQVHGGRNNCISGWSQYLPATARTSGTPSFSLTFNAVNYSSNESSFRLLHLFSRLFQPVPQR